MLIRIRIRLAILMSIQIWVCIPDWHQNNADPNADPSQSFAHFGKLGLKVFYFYSQQWQIKNISFHMSCKCVMILSILQFFGSGSAIWHPGSSSFLTPGSGIRCLFDPLIPDLGSRIPNPYFWELSDNFLGNKFFNSLKICPNFFLQHFETKIIFNFVKFVAT